MGWYLVPFFTLLKRFQKKLSYVTLEVDSIMNILFLKVESVTKGEVCPFATGFFFS